MANSKFKLTSGDRLRIRSWLEKRPGSDAAPKVWDFDKEDGTTIQISRVTQYMPTHAWKVRIAYDVETGYPLVSSSPLKGNLDTKGVKKPQVEGSSLPEGYVPTNYADLVMKAKTQLKAELNKPNPTWDMV